MTTLFGLDIAGIVNSTFGSQLQDATLTKKGSSVVTAGDEGRATQTSTPYPCTGVSTAFAVEYVKGEKILKTDYQVMLLLRSVGDDVLPAAGDTITIAPPNQTTPAVGVVVKVLDVDPAGATATCWVRGAPQ